MCNLNGEDKKILKHILKRDIKNLQQEIDLVYLFAGFTIGSRSYGIKKRIQALQKLLDKLG